MKEATIKSHALCDKISTTNSPKANNTCHLVKDFTTNSSTTSNASKIEKKKLKKHEPTASPYLTGDRVQLLSRVTEKKIVHKKTMDYTSSFPLAINIYKANSDEFKTLKRSNKKNKKSVLTLPTEPAPETQICTVSDMNDSEYYSRTNINNKPRHGRATTKNVRKPRVKNNDFYDTPFRSQLHINLDGSPTDLMARYKGDGKIFYQPFKQDSLHLPDGNKIKKEVTTPHDVWELLRNINRFQFNRSPPMSEESVVVPKKKKGRNKRINRKDTRFIETCRTEEIAYISSYTVDDSSRSITQSSSFDRITVIDNNDEFRKISNVEDRFLKIRYPKVNNKNTTLDSRHKVEKRRVKNGNIKNISYPVRNGKLTEITLKQDSNKINQTNLEDNQSCNEVSSSIVKDDCQSISHSTVTSVCSNREENQTEFQPGIDMGITYFPDSSNTMDISVDCLRGKKKDVKLKHSSRPKDMLSKVTPSCGIRCESITTPIAPPRNDAQKHNLHLVTTMPNACIMPKLTQTEIKRKLATMRFPVIICGKEQMNSSIEVANIDAPQFDGLDKHIWPFMIEWQENTRSKNGENPNEANTKKIVSQLNGSCDDYCLDQDSSKLNIINNKVAKHANHKTKKTANDAAMNKNKTNLKRITVSPNLNTSQLHKPIAQFKDRVLNLLHRKVSSKITDKDYRNESKAILSGPCTKMKAETCTGTQIKSIARLKESQRMTEHENPVHFLNKKSVISFKYPWAKAKRASDFIENVIKNIKNGVYYSKDHKCVNRITEVAMQTDPTSEEEICEGYFSPKVTIKKKNSISVIPGFDRSLLGLEIKTLNMKQIAIKHCVTNVMIQFDVTVPAVIDNIAKSSKISAPIIPIEVTETHTKIFKCKTSILNAILPAELCSIVPTMMKVIDPNRKSIVHPYCTALVDKTKSNLSTITEIARNEVTKAESNKIFECIVPNLSPLKKMLEGMFSNTRNHIGEYAVYKCNPIMNYEYTFVINLLPKVRSNIDIALSTTLKSVKLTYVDPSRSLLRGLNKNKSTSEVPMSLTNKCNRCTALQVYSTKNKRLIPAIKLYDFEEFIRSIFKSQTFWPNIRLNKGTKMCLYMNITVTIENMAIIPQFAKDETKPDELSTKSIRYVKRSTKCIGDNKDQQTERVIKVANNKYKRKNFYKLYRKCKSASSIPIEKNINTPLNKIQTLEDFLLILGSKQMLSGVFDGYAAKKILSSIVEMKNWIMEINPRQALLILLLSNKKDTPNLIRYRPVLLQGIAVNRITRATELDMEIEVIERENLHKLPQYEGITYIAASEENHDQLLEELYWIAKTTASDYQRPFDESSEKLLKSLLEKRKKLNPSYLRVMARYVGLGLLKHPRKNEHSNQ